MKILHGLDAEKGYDAWLQREGYCVAGTDEGLSLEAFKAGVEYALALYERVQQSAPVGSYAGCLTCGRWCGQGQYYNGRCLSCHLAHVALEPPSRWVIRWLTVLDVRSSVVVTCKANELDAIISALLDTMDHTAGAVHVAQCERARPAW